MAIILSNPLHMLVARSTRFMTSSLLPNSSHPSCSNLATVTGRSGRFDPGTLTLPSNLANLFGSLKIPKSIQILKYLASRPGFVRTRAQIIEATHGPRVVMSNRTIDVHITSLRKKLGPAGDLIETVRGVGYRLEEGGPLSS